jgi:membrane protease YdiL (CAAX protease family)
MKAARYARLRGALYLGLLPVLMIAELDRELVVHGRDGAVAALCIDIFLALAIAVDLGRRRPRHPRATALAFFATGARFALLVMLRCFRGVHPLFYVGALAAASAGIATLFLSPEPAEITSHSSDTLATSASERSPHRPRPLDIAFAVLVAVAFPVWLYLVRRSGLGLAPQAALFLGFALFFPWLGAVIARRGSTDGPPRVAEGSRPSPPRIVGAVVASLVLAFSLVRGSQHLLDTTAYAQRCANPQAYASSSVRHFIDAERVETNPARRRASTLSFVLATAILAPVAEELVYRRFLQKILRRRLSAPHAIGISAAIFGVAHLFVYVFTAWQTVLLGVAFGSAFESGGIVAAIAAHMVWNLWLSF